MIMLNLFGVIAVAGGIICFQGNSVEDLSVFHFAGYPGHQVVGVGLFLLAIGLFLRVWRHD